MNTHEPNADRTEQVVSALLSAAGKAPVPPDEAFLDRLSGETKNAFIAASARRSKRFRGLRIMQARTLKWLIPAAAAAAIVLGVSFRPGQDRRGAGPGVAWAEVANSFQRARTVQFTFSRLTADARVLESGRISFKEPDLIRTEAYGKIYIGSVRGGGKVLVLMPETRQAVLQTIPGESGQQENMYEEILRLMGEGAEPIGTETLDGKQLMTFKNSCRNAKLWADPQTRLPVRIEMPRGAAKPGMDVITDFVFDTPLDDSLFSTAVPEGYRLMPVSAEPILARTTAAYALKKLAAPLLKYARDHNEQFPKALGELEPYGITARDLVNPGRPGQSPGYVYIRPSSRKGAMSIVVYEAYDRWDGGVNVLYMDGHVARINDESELKRQLAAAPQHSEEPAE